MMTVRAAGSVRGLSRESKILPWTGRNGPRRGPCKGPPGCNFHRLSDPSPLMIWPFRRSSRNPEPARPPVDAAQIVRRARRLRFRVRPQAVAQLAGAYHGARPGVGLTFAELRAYEPGDDVRHLDWNVTARQGKPVVRRAG